MTTTLRETLSDHARLRDLVSISRDDIDANPIHGFVLAASSELVLLQQQYDFHLEGLRVLRLEDITDVRCTATNRFQKGLLIREGLEQAIAFDRSFDLADWRTIIGQLAREHGLMILECEGPQGDPAFAIGRVRTLSDTSLAFDEFSGVGDWKDVSIEIDLAEITSCQVDTNYINFYRRHFERLVLS